MKCSCAPAAMFFLANSLKSFSFSNIIQLRSLSPGHLEKFQFNKIGMEFFFLLLSSKKSSKSTQKSINFNVSMQISNGFEIPSSSMN